MQKLASSKRFLLDFVKLAPFQIQSIQVDGGSEFRAEFEDACAELNIPLIVLPPAKPKYNGGVDAASQKNFTTLQPASKIPWGASKQHLPRPSKNIVPIDLILP